MSQENQQFQVKQTRREQEQAERLKLEKRERRLALLKRAGLWLAVLAGLGAMVWGLAKLGASSSTGGSAETNSTLADPVTDRDWMLGNKQAAVTVVEYSDLQCPACRAAQPAVNRLLEKFGDQIKFVYRHFPLSSIHKNAEPAARAAEAAGQQGKFWEMHDKLFDTQSSWAELSDAEEVFIQYAEQMGLNAGAFRTSLAAQDTAAEVERDAASAVRSGVGGTPTFFLNGAKLRLQTFSDLETLVADRIAAK